MNIESKFKIGDKVFRITTHTVNELVPCSVCNDTKKVEIQSVKYKCPACDRGNFKFLQRWYVHTSPTTIGQINLCIKLQTEHSCNYFDEDEIQGDGYITVEQYMLAATGIGSGNLWNAKDLFLTLDEAKIETDVRNKELELKESKLPI